MACRNCGRTDAEHYWVRDVAGGVVKVCPGYVYVEADAPMGSTAWRQFTFLAPATPFQRRFAFLHLIDADLALCWAFSVGTGTNELIAAMPGTAQALASAYTAGGAEPGSTMWRSLGLDATFLLKQEEVLTAVNTMHGDLITFRGVTYSLPS